MRLLHTASLLLVLLAGCTDRSADEHLAASFSTATANGPAIDHSDWQATLDTYLLEGDDLNRVDYGQLSRDGGERLSRYLADMAAIDPRRHPAREQMAYWINVYNALTVKLVADAWPVASILEIGDGLPGRGPWRDEVFTVNGRSLSLDDIEHGILRRVWREPRIHFAVNCASVGCPDLQPRAFTGATLDRQLTDAARGFLASPRGVAVSDDGRTLRLSSLFDWYAEDFGSDLNSVRATLARFADAETRARLNGPVTDVRYDYDWSLNGTP